MIERDIPQMIDNPPQIVFWETDDLLPVLLAMGFGVIMNGFTTSVLAGLALSVVYIRYKRNMLPGTLHHMGYWYGFMSLNRIFTNGLAREFIQ